jgi:hypothetical protein
MQNKKIQRYQRSKKVYKVQIEDLEDRILSEVSRSQVVSRESAATIARLLKNLDDLGSQLVDHRNQLTTLQRLNKRWQMRSGRAKSSLGNVRDALRKIKTFSMTDHGLYTPQACSLAPILSRGLIKAGILCRLVHWLESSLMLGALRQKLALCFMTWQMNLVYKSLGK